MLNLDLINLQFKKEFHQDAQYSVLGMTMTNQKNFQRSRQSQQVYVTPMKWLIIIKLLRRERCLTRVLSNWSMINVSLKL